MNQPFSVTYSRIRSVAHLPNWFWTVVLALLTAVLTAGIVGDFQHPLSDGNDTDQYEYVGYFLGQNLTFWPWPQLNLLNNQVFYPYGLNQVFLDWGFERDYWYATCYWLLGGAGPYLQYYYVYSLIVAAVGTFLLLRPRFGRPKSFIAGLIVSIFNFYAIFKFPVHMNVCVGHWTVLCIVATYRLLYDVWHRQPVSLPFVLLWTWLQVQVLGQELGYVAGFGLTFTTLTLPIVAVLLYRQYPRPRRWLMHLRGYVRHQFGRYRGRIAGLILLILFSCWLYIPLTLQIAFAAWQFNFGAVPQLRAWSHPVRLLIPHLPGVAPSTLSYTFLRDTFESYGQGSPGLYLTILAGIGLWQTRRKTALWLPIVTMLLLCLLYHPVLFPTLKLFPWFSFNRHGGRASLVYPVLLMLLALPIRWPVRWFSIAIAGGLGLLMLNEWTHGFQLRLAQPTVVASSDLLRYCNIIRQQPGVAVLDWPFCTVGGNGVGLKEGLCPYYEQQNAVFSLRRFHDKKVVGQYFGRLHPNQIQPFLRDGWPRLLTPDRAFTAQDWQFLDAFLRTNHFAGINLYPDLLTPEQTAAFYKRYGPPTAQTTFPAAGRVVFIPVRSTLPTQRK